VAADDVYTTPLNVPLDVAAPGVLLNDTDTEGDPLTAVLDSGPAHGTLVLNADGSFTYTPAPGFLGADSFAYRATDGQAESSVATVRITVTGTRLFLPLVLRDGWRRCPKPGPDGSRARSLG
jgi:VCBS repeat-containing protein